MKCSVFIDESGDAGISKVRIDGQRGSSPYFVLAAAVIPNTDLVGAKQILDAVETRIPKKWAHATDLNHPQKVFFAREASKLRVRYFSVISRKSTLGVYADEIRRDPDLYYNKCTHYLLECVGKYLSSFSTPTDEPDVVFENRNHDFDRLIRFIGAIKSNPHHENARYLRVFNPFGFIKREKREEALLKYADLAAFSTYQCVNKIEANFDIPETRYLREIAVRFGCDAKGAVLGSGIKCIQGLHALGLDEEIVDFLKSLRAMPPPPPKK